MKVQDILSIVTPEKPKVTPQKPPAFRSSITPEPDALQGQAGVNLGRIISDHGTVEIEELDAKIVELTHELEDLQRERDFIQELVDATERYKQLVATAILARTAVTP